MAGKALDPKLLGDYSDNDNGTENEHGALEEPQMPRPPPPAMIQTFRQHVVNMESDVLTFDEDQRTRMTNAVRRGYREDSPLFNENLRRYHGMTADNLIDMAEAWARRHEAGYSLFDVGTGDLITWRSNGWAHRQTGNQQRPLLLGWNVTDQNPRSFEGFEEFGEPSAHEEPKDKKKGKEKADPKDSPLIGKNDDFDPRRFLEDDDSDDPINGEATVRQLWPGTPRGQIFGTSDNVGISPVGPRRCRTEGESSRRITNIHRIEEDTANQRSRAAAARQIRLEEEGTLPEWQAGNTVRFLAQDNPRLKIMLSLERGRNFSGSRPPECPEREEYPRRRRKVLVGITTDDVENERRRKKNSDDIQETPRRNELAYIRLQNSNVEYINQAGQRVSSHHVRLDQEFRDEGAIEVAAQRITNERRAWEVRETQRYSTDMSRYRNEYREWEYSLLIREWRNGNRSIFDPKCTEADIKDSRNILDRQLDAEARGEYPTNFKAVEQRRIIPRPRLSTTTHPANYPDATEEEMAEVMETPTTPESTGTPVKRSTRKRKSADTSGPRKTQRITEDKVKKDRRKAFTNFEKKEKEYKEKRQKQVEADFMIAEAINNHREYLLNDIRIKRNHGKPTDQTEDEITTEFVKNKMKKDLNKMKYRGKVPARPINPATGKYAKRSASLSPTPPLPSSPVAPPQVPAPPSPVVAPENLPPPPHGTPPAQDRETDVLINNGRILHQDTNGRYYFINEKGEKRVVKDQIRAKAMDDELRREKFFKTNKKDKKGRDIYENANGELGYMDKDGDVEHYEEDELDEVQKTMGYPRNDKKSTQPTKTPQTTETTQPGETPRPAETAPPAQPTHSTKLNWDMTEMRQLAEAATNNNTVVNTGMLARGDPVFRTPEGIFLVQRRDETWDIPNRMRQLVIQAQYEEHQRTS